MFTSIFIMFCSAQVEVAVPLSLAWDLWSDKEGINRWMPWIHSIKVDICLSDCLQF